MPTSADALPPADHGALSGRTVLLSGATGAVGATILDKLVTAGAKVAVAVRKEWQVKPLRERLGGAPSLVAHVATGDGEAAAGFVKGATDALGPIDALVSSAGAFGFAEVGRDPAGLAADLIAANFLAVHTLARAVVPSMRRRRTGTLVFTGARAVGSQTPGMAVYLAAKAALHEYARTLAAEVAADGVRVAVIAPGILDTPSNREAMPDADRSDWIPVDRVADALLAAAAGSAAGSADPILPLASGSGS